MLKKIIKLIIILTFPANNIFAADIPIIVISPGKTVQSESVVGSSVSVIQGSKISNSSEFFLADILDNNLTGMHSFRTGGYGTTSAVQLRGLPKRYSTIYIDGVKMSDPSTPTNSFDLTSIMKSGIDRIEILRGSQSTLYGSHAIGGTINIFTKRGVQKKVKSFDVSSGSNGTNNINFSYGGSKDKHDYFVSLDRFLTGGISARNDDGETDAFENDSLITNYGYKISENFKIENSLRYNDSFLNYDLVTNGLSDVSTNSDDRQFSNSLRLIQKTKNGKNTFFYNKLYSERDTNESATSRKGYIGKRDAFNFLGEYNINLDTKIIYGLENEFDYANFLDDDGRPLQSDEAIYSQYFDVQFRLLEKLYSTIGFRRDQHTTSAEAYTGRATIAYKLDNKSKIRSSFGTGVRYASLYEYFYGTTMKNKDNLSPELSESFDVGYESSLEGLNIDFDITAYHITYDDAIEGWQSNTDGTQPYGGWGVSNTSGEIVSKGIEFNSNWKPKNNFNIGLNYNYADTFDGADCNDPDIGAGCIDKAMVRIPRHAVATSLNYLTKNKINNSLIIKHKDETRDYGNGNNSYADVMLGAYTTVDYQASYKLYNTFNLYLSASNLFDESYETSWGYSAMGRSFNFAIRHIY